MDKSLIRDVVQTAAAIAAMAAAAFSYLGIAHSRRAQQSTVYLGMAARYDSPDMRDACNKLLAWKRLYGDRSAQAWSMGMSAGSEDALAVNTARRIVARHFLNIAKLRKINAIDSASARLLAECYGLNVFYQIVVPMNELLAADVRDFEALTQRLMKIRRTYANGELIAWF
jgi:hypothetical protein